MEYGDLCIQVQSATRRQIHRFKIANATNIHRGRVDDHLSADSLE